MSEEDRFWLGKVWYRLSVEGWRGVVISIFLDCWKPITRFGWILSSNLFRGLLKYAEIHGVLIRKKHGFK